MLLSLAGLLATVLAVPCDIAEMCASRAPLAVDDGSFVQTFCVSGGDCPTPEAFAGMPCKDLQAHFATLPLPQLRSALRFCDPVPHALLHPPQPPHDETEQATGHGLCCTWSLTLCCRISSRRTWPATRSMAVQSESLAGHW